MTDPTGTYAQHPALVTVAGAATPPRAGDDPTGTDAAHPAIVTRPGGDLQPVPAASASHPKKRRLHRRRRHRRRHKRHR